MLKLEKKVIDFLERSPDIILGVMFGSLTRGKGSANSDLDLGIAANKPLTAKAKKGLIEELAIISGRPVDLVDLRMAGEPILHKILTTGTLIYCADHGFYAELIKKMLFDEADFMPYRRRILSERKRAWIGT